MGKKKPQKTEELLSVAIAEASSTGEGDKTPQQQPLVQTPRKRGRPRKIFESEENRDQEAAAQVRQREVTGEHSQPKKLQTSKEEQEVIKAEASSASMEITQKKGVQSVVGEPSKEPPRSRARRKSKPRKSS